MELAGRTTIDLNPRQQDSQRPGGELESHPFRIGQIIVRATCRRRLSGRPGDPAGGRSAATSGRRRDKPRAESKQSCSQCRPEIVAQQRGPPQSGRPAGSPLCGPAERPPAARATTRTTSGPRLGALSAAERVFPVAGKSSVAPVARAPRAGRRQQQVAVIIRFQPPPAVPLDQSINWRRWSPFRSGRLSSHLRLSWSLACKWPPRGRKEGMRTSRLADNKWSVGVEFGMYWPATSGRRRELGELRDSSCVPRAR